MEEKEKLKKEVGVLGLLFLSVGLNIGGALFILPGLGAKITGSGIIIAEILAIVPVLCAALVHYRILATARPLSGASYRYASFVSPPIAFAIGMSLIVGVVFGVSLWTHTAGEYLMELISVPVTLTAFLVVTALYVVNVLGIKFTSYIQIIISLVMLGAIFTFIFSGVPHIESQNLALEFPKGIVGLLACSGLFFTLSAGGLWAVDIGGEVIDPDRYFGKVLPIAILLVVFITILVFIVSVGVVGGKELAGQNLTFPGRLFLSPNLLAFFATGGAITASITTLNAVFASFSRQMMQISFDGFFPDFLTRVSERFGTPHWGLTVFYIASCIVIFSGIDLTTMGMMLNLGMMLQFCLVLLGAYLLPKKYPEIYENASFKVSRKVLTITTLLGLGFALIFCVVVSMLIGPFVLLLISLIAVSYIYARKVHKNE